MTPAFVRLYNMMHYGRMAALSAMVLFATAVPLAAAGVTYALAGRAMRAGSHG
jgi:hypothetical protein